MQSVHLFQKNYGYILAFGDWIFFPDVQSIVRIEVLTALILKIAVFWDVTPCSFGQICWCFRVSCCIQLIVCSPDLKPVLVTGGNVARVEINIIVWNWFIETRNVSRTHISKHAKVVLTLETRMIVTRFCFANPYITRIAFGMSEFDRLPR
jgi:hypothetical protein